MRFGHSRHGVTLALALAGCSVAPDNNVEESPLGADSAAACTEFGDPPATLVSPQSVPTCNADGSNAREPVGELLPAWPDATGLPRSACLWSATGATPASPLPLLVYLHPSKTTADILAGTKLLDVLDTVNLSGDPSRPGMLVLAPEGRDTTHYYPQADATGTGWDMWYRQFSDHTVDGAPENVDFATIDHFVQVAVARGIVDPLRVYVMGWSNGAGAAYEYALFRPSLIAAAVIYSSGGSPFGTFSDPCPQTPVLGIPTDTTQIQIPRVGLPVFTIQNSCDIGGSCPLDQAFSAELGTLGEVASDQITGSLQLPVNACVASCAGPDEDLADSAIGALNHLQWPTDWNAKMLAFLAAHPHS